LGYLLINRKARGNLVKSLFGIDMCRLLLIMHHIAFCTSCITLLLMSHTCALYDTSRRAEAKNSSGASSIDVWRSTSIKWQGY
jgi:hypothetical protein